MIWFFAIALRVLNRLKVGITATLAVITEKAGQKKGRALDTFSER